MATRTTFCRTRTRVVELERPPCLQPANTLVLRNDEKDAFSRMDAEFASRLEDNSHLHDETAEAYVSAQNVVCVVHLSEKVSLRDVAMRWFNKYVPQKFEACIIRTRWGKSQATILLFRTGNSVCVGTKSVEESMLACHTLRLELHNSGYRTMFAQFRPVNGVYSFKVPYGIDLSNLWEENQDIAQWVPRLFPGLELTLHDNDHGQDEKVVVRVFDTGAVVMMGVPNFNRRAQLTRKTKNFLRNYKDANVPEEGRFQYRNERMRDASRRIKAVQNAPHLGKRQLSSVDKTEPPIKRTRFAK